MKKYPHLEILASGNKKVKRLQALGGVSLLVAFTSLVLMLVDWRIGWLYLFLFSLVCLIVIVRKEDKKISEIARNLKD